MGQECCTMNQKPALNSPRNLEITNTFSKCDNFGSSIISAKVHQFDLFTEKSEVENTLHMDVKLYSNYESIYNYDAEDFEEIPREEFAVNPSELPFHSNTFAIKSAREGRRSYLNKLENLASDNSPQLIFDFKVRDRIISMKTSQNIAHSGTGYCRLLSQSTEYFEGIIKNYKIYEGILVMPNGDYYMGFYHNYLPNGQISLFCSNGDTFEGYMVRGLKSGKGSIKWSDGSRFCGTFKDDLKSGKGEYIYANGDTYKGGYILDAKTGYGNHQH